MGKMRLVILGATGSIGTQALDVVRMHPDKLEVVALAAGRRVDEMVRYARSSAANTLPSAMRPVRVLPRSRSLMPTCT